jgi:broad specificity phosphatase PhoE
MPQIVHLIRHGQGYHNVYGEADEEAYKSGKYTDAHLTRLGWQQVRRAMFASAPVSALQSHMPRMLPM